MLKSVQVLSLGSMLDAHQEELCWRGDMFFRTIAHGLDNVCFLRKGLVITGLNASPLPKLPIDDTERSLDRLLACFILY